MVLRYHTLQVVQEALLHLGTITDPGEGPAVLVSGSPGIGKSFSFIPALVRGLAQGRGGPVPPVIIIEDRFLGTVVKLRLNGRGAVTSAHRISLAHFEPASDPDLRLGTTVYIVDPTSTNITEGSPSDVAARTVVVSSPNSSHFKDFEKRRPSPHPLFMEPWTLYELLAARVHIDPSVPQETVVERWMAQGGNPRHVLCEKSDFAKAQRRTESKIETLPDHVLQKLITAPESIRLEEGDETAPNSAVVAYTSVHPFTEPCGVFISDSVLRAVAHMFYSRVFHWINNARPSDCRGTASDAFQAIACEVLAGKCQFQVAALRMGELMVPPCPVSPHPHTPLGVFLEGLVYQPVVASGSTVFHVLLCASVGGRGARGGARAGAGAGAGALNWPGMCRCRTRHGAPFAVCVFFCADCAMTLLQRLSADVQLWDGIVGQMSMVCAA